MKYRGWDIEYKPKLGTPGIMDWDGSHEDVEEMLAGKSVEDIKAQINEFIEEAQTEPSCNEGVLKPCPFCGEQPRYSPATKDTNNPPHGWPHQIVHDCNTIGVQFCIRTSKLSLQGEKDTKEAVFKVWNKRI